MKDLSTGEQSKVERGPKTNQFNTPENSGYILSVIGFNILRLSFKKTTQAYMHNLLQFSSISSISHMLIPKDLKHCLKQFKFITHYFTSYLALPRISNVVELITKARTVVEPKSSIKIGFVISKFLSTSQLNFKIDDRAS